MDEISKINRTRWNALADANVMFSRPFIDFTHEDAERYIFRHGIIKDVQGKRVLCLASGGGQDSVALGLLGAEVTVFDLSDVQLERDRIGAEHHKLITICIQGDMRDLSPLGENAFDLVWQAFSINFVPQVEQVFDGVRRVLKPGGVYFLQFANPFTMAMDDKWNGSSYAMYDPYIDGVDISLQFPQWDVDRPDGTSVKCDSPHEFRHTLGKMLNSLTSRGFRLLGLWEWTDPQENPAKGSWAHYTQVAPPWFSTFWQLEKEV